ncbi:MAG: SpoIIE family protein phosphatase [Actinomycetota bacterium]|nr:SpoIIE family protein phosphatase [Actinomycetota bacterium]
MGEGAASTRASDPVRLAAVASSGLLDSEPDERFDRLAGLAALLLEAPMAFVTVVDARRSWFKSCIGMAAGSEREVPLAHSFCQYVIESSRPLIVADARTDPLTAGNPAIDSAGVAAWAGFPVTGSGGEVLGTLCVVDTVPRSWTERDVTVLETLADAVSANVALRAALTAEQEARQVAEATAAQAALAAAESTELSRMLMASTERFASLAHTLQQSLLPPHLPDVPGLELAARYLPATAGGEVVGDFYDVFQSNRPSWGVVMGDVSGKGPSAATLTGLARYTVRAAAMRTTVPSRVLRMLNDALLAQREDDDERFLTVVYANVRRRPGRDQVDVALCSGGHLPPLLHRADGTLGLVEAPGMALGLFPDPTLRDHKLSLDPGDALILYTDGVTEARHDALEFGCEGLMTAVAETTGMAAADKARHVEIAVEEFRDGQRHDDTAVLVLQVPAPAPSSAQHVDRFAYVQ